MQIKIGDKLPSFNLKNDANETITEKNLATDSANKFTVLYFYPKDDTPGCTSESIDFNENLEQFKQLNTEIIGVSKDSIESHHKFKNKYALNFSLLADPNLELHKALGAYGEKTSYGKTSLGTIRSTFIINNQLNIVHIFPKVVVKGHVAEVLAAIENLK